MKKSSFKKKIIIHPFILIPLFVWIGFVCSISFMEAWLKFRAPNVTIPIGLSIGKLVFGVLNKMEWVFAGLMTVLVFIGNKRQNLKNKFLFFFAILILFFQTMFLLPSLNERAEAISHGVNMQPSLVHFFYIFLEILKVTSLFIFGINVICDLDNNPLQGKENQF